MFKIIGIIVAIILLCINSVCFAVDDSLEPPLKYTLYIDGQHHEIVLNKSVQIQGTYSDPTFLLRVSSIREFTYGGITFQYPSSFGWEAEIDAADEKRWTLSGNDFIIMYFILPDKLSADSFAQVVAKKFGTGNTRISDTERTLGGVKYKGKLLFVKIGGTAILQEIYTLPAEAGSRLLVFQDTLPDKGTQSQEGEKAWGMLTKSFSDNFVRP